MKDCSDNATTPSTLLAMLLACMATGCDDPSRPLPETLPEAIAVPAELDSAQPHLSVGDDGAIVLSWLERHGAGHRLRYATYLSTTWSAASTVTEGDDFFANWADFPSVQPFADDFWAAHWLVRTDPGPYAYDVAIAVSQDAGRSWSDPITPHADATPTEHGFVSLYPAAGGAAAGAGAIWLDGRDRSKDTGAGMTLRSAVVSRNGRIENEQLVDELVCDCCQTDVAQGIDGPIVVYRDRTDGEIRDIYAARMTGGKWQTAQRVAADGWEINGCPVNGPAIATFDRTAVVAWFTMAGDRPSVRVAWSIDEAIAFDPPVEIDGATTIGRVDVVLVDHDQAVVSWIRRTVDGHAEVCVRRVMSNGRLGDIHIIARTRATRPAGFPQMVVAGDHLLLAWTDVGGDRSRIRSARFDLRLL